MVVNYSKKKDNSFFKNNKSLWIGKEGLGIIKSICVLLLEDKFMQDSTNHEGDINHDDSNK